MPIILGVILDPKMPEDIVDDYTKWISNFDIEAVLRQHHEETPGVY